MGEPVLSCLAPYRVGMMLSCGSILCWMTLTSGATPRKTSRSRWCRQQSHLSSAQDGRIVLLTGRGDKDAGTLLQRRI